MEALVHAALARQLGHPQGELCVRNDLRSVVHEASSRKLLAEWVIVPEAIASMKLGQPNAFGRVLRVQVEGKPQDLGVELAP